MLRLSDLWERMLSIDGRGYGAYKSIAGSYEERGITVFFDHIQPDPYAPPSAVRIRVDQRLAALPFFLFNNRDRRIALEDFIANKLARRLSSVNKGSAIRFNINGQCVLERSCLRINDKCIEVRLTVALPARGRTILGKAAKELMENLLSLVVTTVNYNPKQEAEYISAVELYEDQEYIREQLSSLGLVAFIANGSLLPRASGVSDLPLKDGITFISPPSLEIGVKTLHHGIIRGMGIPEGVTLIVGGGYHGKSTLLRAIQEGVYNHRLGDGREWCITRHDAFKIRAEDGRAITNVDISMFIDNLPQGTDTSHFSTTNASGSTSMAAAIVEALEAGCRLMLIDEDTSATNFMIRDARMQRLVGKPHEPITPLVDQIKNLFEVLGVSTILVMGGSGDYFDVADVVIKLEEYKAADVTSQAHEIALALSQSRTNEAKPPQLLRPRIFKGGITRNEGEYSRVKISPLARQITVGDQLVDISSLEQLVDNGQALAIGHCLRIMDKHENKPVNEILDHFESWLDDGGLDELGRFGYPPSDLARPRRYEIAAALNRVRGVSFS